MSKEEFGLAEKVALVVGGRGYLGRYFCSVLRERGATVYAADLPEGSRASKADTGQPTGAGGVVQKDVDVVDPSSVQKLVTQIVKEESRIDILVYAVTTKSTDFYSSFTECSLQGWQQILKVELDGLFLVTQAVGKAMENHGKGSIILLSSIYGVVGNDQRIYEDSNLAELYAGGKRGQKTFAHAGYATAKGGVIALTRFLAAYWQGTDIRVNCVSPGGVHHPGESEAFTQKYASRVPMGRKAQVSEVANAVAYLASDAAGYINGHNLVVDGGWTSW